MNTQLTKNSDEATIRCYFNGVLELSKSSERFPIDLDDVWRIAYAQKVKAVLALQETFIEGIDFNLSQNGKVINSSEIQNGVKVSYHLSIPCLEYFIARKIRPVFEVYRQVFHKAAENSFASLVPTNFAEALQLAADQQKRIMALQEDNNEKTLLISDMTNTINDMQSRVSYLDQILACKSTVTVTAIAQDYGMSAKAFNTLLRNFGVQHKVSKQWILYAKYLNNGYVQSKTYTFDHKDGSQGIAMTTEWTQKGRLFLYNLLKEHDVLPMIER